MGSGLRCRIREDHRSHIRSAPRVYLTGDREGVRVRSGILHFNKRLIVGYLSGRDGTVNDRSVRTEPAVGDSTLRSRRLCFAWTTWALVRQRGGHGVSIIGVALRTNETEPETHKIRTAGGSNKPTALEQVTNALAAYVKWMPAEAVVAYGALVTSNWDHQLNDILKANPNVPADQLPKPVPDASLWWNCLILSALLMLLLSMLGKKWPGLIRKTIMAPIGFMLWSTTLANSWSSSWKPIQNADWTAAGLWIVIGGGLLAFAGEKLLAWEIKEDANEPWTGMKRILKIL